MQDLVILLGESLLIIIAERLSLFTSIHFTDFRYLVWLKKFLEF